MCPQCNEHCHDGCRVAGSGEKETQNNDLLYPLNFTSSEHSTISLMSEGKQPTLVYRRRNLRGKSTLVYRRRKLRGKSTLVYQRRKLRGNSVAIFTPQDPANTKRSDDCLSVVSSDDPSHAARELDVVRQMEYETVATVTPVVPQARNLSKCVFLNPDSVSEQRGFDVLKSRECRRVEVDSIDDSCSSSKFVTDIVSTSMRKEADDAGECSSSSVIESMSKDVSAKDLCISILKREGLLETFWPTNTCGSAEGMNISSSCCMRSCKICSVSGTALEMLICDHCEEAFHISCCNPCMKKMPTDEWFCHLCSRKKRKILKEASTRKSLNNISELDRCMDTFSKTKCNPIELMLRDTDPYTTGVRIGKGFQAEVPDWSGPVYSDVDTIREEPLEINLSDYCTSHELGSSKPFVASCIGNWLQCKQVIESTSGTICGKWRRAPLFEVQTDDWECFCSVQWNPAHADCAVPQKLETEEILKQLKQIEMLRPKLTAKRRKRVAPT